MSATIDGLLVTDPQRPWPGLLSYPEEAARLFHGRAAEVRELDRLLDHETVSFLYGKSGLGKTSLLQAGLFPRLRETGRVPVYLRLSFDTTAPSAKVQLFSAMVAAMEQASIDAPRPLPDESAWAYLHRRAFEWWSPRNQLVRPVFVFDQFEEIFTLGQETAESRATSAQAIELLMELTMHRPDADQRRAFAREPESVEGYDYDAANYQLLFAFREDFLPQFDQLRERLRINPHNRLALERLRGAAATESVVGTGGALVTAEVAQDIVRFVAGESDAGPGSQPLELLEVEPWLLCLVCQQLNEQRLAAPAPMPRISAELLTGTRDLILAQYYAACVAPFDARVPAFLEDRLLTDSGFRNPYPYDEAIRLDGISARVIAALVDSRLLRKEQHMGAQRVEISHDVLGPVLLRYRQQRQQQEADAISAIRDVSNRRRVAEGRRRSGRFVVLTTAIITTLAIAVVLRAREARRANHMVGWGQELQSNTYSLLLEVVKTRPVPAAVRGSIDKLIDATRTLRAKYPNETQITAQHLQLAYLAAVATEDTLEQREKRAQALALADTLAKLPVKASEEARDVETAFRVAGVLAQNAGEIEVLKTNLRRQAALLDVAMIPAYNKHWAITASRRLAEQLPPGPERLALLRRAVAAFDADLMREMPESEEPVNINALAQRLADTLSATPGADSSTIRQMYQIARDARLVRYRIAARLSASDTTAARRNELVGVLGNLGWAQLLAGDPEASYKASAAALSMDSTQAWIRQNLLHARVFLGDLDRVADELQRLRGTTVDVGNARRPFADVALEDISAFRKARLTHRDLDAYERLMRGGSR